MIIKYKVVFSEVLSVLKMKFMSLYLNVFNVDVVFYRKDNDSELLTQKDVHHLKAKLKFLPSFFYQ